MISLYQAGEDLPESELCRANQSRDNANNENARLGTASRLRTLPESEQSSPTSDSTSKRPARLVALSRLTWEGRGKLFHSVPSGSNSVMDATAQLCRERLWQSGRPVNFPSRLK